MIKTIGDEVMIVGSDAARAARLGGRLPGSSRPSGRCRGSASTRALTLYRDGDYYGRAVNLAARVGARAAGGEVLVTRPLVEPAATHLEFERIGEVKLKGFSRVDRAVPRAPGGPSEPRGSVSREAGLLRPGAPVVVLLSGGPRLGLPARPRGARLRRGQRRCTSTTACATRRPRTPRTATRCARRLGVPLRDPPPAPARGQPAGVGARRPLRARRPRLAAERDADVAAGHTASDQVETVLYRLAASPGRRALLGMRAARGPARPPAARRLAAPRPRRGAPSTACRGARTRPTRARAFARNRARRGLVPALRELHPAAEANVLRTVELLRDEAAVLDAAVGAALAGAGDPPRARGPARAAARARAARRPAARRARRAAPARRATARTRSWRSREHGALDVGGGLRARIERGCCGSRARRPGIRAS